MTIYYIYIKNTEAYKPYFVVKLGIVSSKDELINEINHDDIKINVHIDLYKLDTYLNLEEIKKIVSHELIDYKSYYDKDIYNNAVVNIFNSNVFKNSVLKKIRFLSKINFN